eukprot:TRINITY_DN1771_c0_g1_i2.p1 TRINITY_DN1771_c0_g1~~TRINITY_DN1771_c0_g1_i2.p1  ORF type:complete len:149 (-),score=27.44 TRINITY_DN1771_c0_g1_i2:40-486(-)
MDDGPPPKRSARQEVYGFVGWMATWVILFAYLIWTFLPDSVLHPLGITYYPDRYWAILGPQYLLVTFIFSIICYGALNLMDTAPLDSYNLLTDKDAREVGIQDLLKEEGDVPPIADVPITVVNEILYNTKPDPTEEDAPILYNLKFKS